jgi:hypothetical protein
MLLIELRAMSSELRASSYEIASEAVAFVLRMMIEGEMWMLLSSINSKLEA